MPNRKIVKVTWLDAASHLGTSRSSAEHAAPESFLERQESYGFIVRKNKKALVLANEESEDELDIIAIPSSQIINIEGVN
jgi:hypothetical protein